MADNAAKISKIFELLRPGVPSTFQQRFRDAEHLLVEANSYDSCFFVQLISAVIESDELFQNADTIFQQVIFSLDEADLREIATKITTSKKADEDLYSMTASIAAQIPDAFPIEALRQLPDYQQWFESPNPLAKQAAWHLTFEDPQPAEQVSSIWPRHPTWKLPVSGEPVVVGGKSEVSCLACGRPRVHLLTLPVVPKDLGVSSERIALETCGNCTSPAFFSHAENGEPRQLSPLPMPGTVSDEVYPIAKRARLAKTPQRWTRQIWALGDQNLFRLGGLPSWVQYSEIPTAPGSERPMRFLAQFDSFFDNGDSSAFLWGSGGLLYVFWDDLTRTSCTFAQWT